jgi:predicted nucleotidyltransferase
MRIPGKYLKAFEKAVKAERTHKGVLAIFATGSFARGDVAPYSDIDLTIILEKDHVLPLERLEYCYIENVLVGFRRVSREGAFEEFNKPLQWLWNKEGVENIKIAYDPYNIIRELQAQAEKQQPTTPQFREAASQRVVRTVEYIHKLLNAHLGKDPLNILYAAFIIQENLAEAMFLLNEIPIKSENTFEKQLFEECDTPEGFYEDYLIIKRILGSPDPKKVFRAAIRLFHQVYEFFKEKRVFFPKHLATVEKTVQLYKDYISNRP